LEIFIKQKKNGIEHNLLELVPSRNYEHNYREENLIDVLVPRFNDRIFGKILQPRLKNPFIRANLDELGSNTWELNDKKKSVTDIINLMTDKFSEENDIENRIVVFIQNLYKNGFIKFINIKQEIENV